MISIYYSQKCNNVLLINLTKSGNVYVHDKTMGSTETIEVLTRDLIRSEYEFIGNLKEWLCWVIKDIKNLKKEGFN